MASNFPPLTAGNYYHIYYRGNNRGDIFIQPRNYAYFLDLWWKHTFQIAETYAYCLLKNHFHASVYIKDLTAAPLAAETPIIKPPSQYFSNLFNAYTRGVNIATGRSGSIFEGPFERIPITEERYMLQLIIYIHQNPQKHGFVKDFRQWSHSSYHDLVADGPTRLQRQKVMELFGSRADFLRLHQEIQPLKD